MDDVEVTLVNPGTAEAARFAAYRTASFHRSIGVSLDDAALAAIGRIHSAAEAVAAYRPARAAAL